MSDSDASDHFLIAHGDLQGLVLLPITIDEILRGQQADYFCRALIARLQNGKKMFFSKNEDGIFFRLAYGVKQVVASKALQARVLQLLQ